MTTTATMTVAVTAMAAGTDINHLKAAANKTGVAGATATKIKTMMAAGVGKTAGTTTAAAVVTMVTAAMTTTTASCGNNDNNKNGGDKGGGNGKSVSQANRLYLCSWTLNA